MSHAIERHGDLRTILRDDQLAAVQLEELRARIADERARVVVDVLDRAPRCR
jgi:hypothetical protein